MLLQTKSNTQNLTAVFTFFVFHQKCLSWANLVKKPRNCQFKVKLDTQINLNMQNSMTLFTFFFFCNSEIPVLDKFGPRNHNYHFKLKFGGQPNSNMQNSMAVLTFFISDQKCPFWANFEKICTWLKRGSQFGLEFTAWTNWNRGAGSGPGHGWVSVVGWSVLAIVGLEWFAGYLGLVFVVNGALRGKFSFCFPGVFCQYWQNIHLGGDTVRWAIIL